MKTWKEIKKWTKKDGYYINPENNKEYCYVENDASIDNTVKIGIGVQIHEHATIKKHAEIQRYCNIGPFATIEESATIKRHSHISLNSYIGKNVTIGSESDIGVNTIIHNDLEIGDNTKIGEGIIIPMYKSGENETIHWNSIGKIQLGYVVEHFAWWNKNLKKKVQKNNYKQYQLFVKQIIEWEKTMGDLLGQTMNYWL